MGLFWLVAGDDAVLHSADGMMGGGTYSCGRVLHIWVNSEAMLFWLSSFLLFTMFGFTAQRMASPHSGWGSPAPS